MRTTVNTARAVFRRFVTDIDHLPAARVFVGLAIPGLVLVAIGRTDLLIYAVFGSFTGMYGFAEAPRQRLTHQCAAAVLLVGAVGAGILLGRLHTPPAVLVSAVAVFAALASPVTDRLGLRPEGPFFGIFAFGAIAMVADTQRQPLLALLICAGTAVLCIAVGYRESARKVRRGTASAAPIRCRPHRRGIDSTTHAARYALAISVSGGIGLLLGVGHANWAMAGAVVPLAAATARDRMTRGVHRVVGTFLGLLVAAPLLMPGPSPAILGLAIIALLYPTELFMARHYAVALGFFTPLIMAMTELAEPTDPLTMLTERGLDTVIGVAVGSAVALLIRDPAPHTDDMADDDQRYHRAAHALEIARVRTAAADARDDG
ncbi:FUSC family protein [Nocardia caishijiensis]|uniref:Fusaric acid resistance family protein n=1 Tax=Nocardia caishijiensis TaxID=184756 RepID=A0ABQ6YIL3_9NOCA|nr:FUSC family protein [Nocardia caishijiensis]KAF0845366.1 fusaric acid resistance family protein [Nocardia caishijiensis]